MEQERARYGSQATLIIFFVSTCNLVFLDCSPKRSLLILPSCFSFYYASLINANFPVFLVMMTITVEDYENQYWPKLQGAITQLLTMTPGDYIPISYEQMYRFVIIVMLMTLIVYRMEFNKTKWSCPWNSEQNCT